MTRRSIRGMSANDPDLAAMRRAVAAMKRLPQSAARNWTRFADIHRNFCPHANWYFLPWHRAYIRAFERICRELSGTSDFALPYWNWTADRQFPAAFAAGDRDSNPLFHPRPGGASGLRLADDVVGPAVMSAIMTSPDFEAFGRRGRVGRTAPPRHGSGGPVPRRPWSSIRTTACTRRSVATCRWSRCRRAIRSSSCIMPTSTGCGPPGTGGQRQQP